MEKIVWTNEQLEAINTRDRNLLVSAAAGSGKTALLTERLKRLVLDDKVDCTKILVLTFTRAAAAEMKQRFKNKLFESLSDHDNKISDKEIINQINALTDAQISTIDSFASTMIRRYFETAGVDPNFRIADLSELNLIVDEIIDDTFEELFSKAEDIDNKDQFAKDFLHLVDIYGGTRTNEGLKVEVRKLLNFLDTLPYPKEWLEEFTKEVDGLEEETYLESDLYAPFRDQITDLITNLINSYEELDSLKDEIPWSKSSKSHIPYENEIASILDLKNAKSFTELVEKIVSIKLTAIYFPKAKSFLPLKEVITEIRGDSKKGIRKDFVDLQKTLQSINPKKDLDNTKKVNKNLKTLIKLVEIIRNKLLTKKEELGILYFSDLERILLKILDDPKVKDSLQRDFSHIFIDEYQDTNSLQEAIIKKIENGSNRFMVGDLKQSIYHFRNAEPKIFLDILDSYKDSEENSLVLLNQNFRSSLSVIEGINNIFEKIMTPELGDVRYDESNKLIPARTDETKKPEIHILNRQLEEDDLVLQTRFIARKIKEIIKENSSISYKDIGILFRSINKKAKVIIETLIEEGIPVIFEGESENIVAEEISIFLRLLNLIDNHKQDIPLLAILSLPVFGFSLDDRAKIREAFPEEAYYYQAVERYRDEKNDDLSSKLKIFYNRLNNWRDESKLLEIDEFLWNLLLSSGLYHYYGNQFGGNEKKKNLRVLIDKAIDYKKSSLKGLPSFLQYVSRLEKKGENITNSKNNPDSINAVSLMSVHKSKGLEFPVLFVADLHKKFNLTKSKDLEYDKDLGIGARYLDLKSNILVKEDTLLSRSIHEHLKNQELSEEMRLLYVALTRAKDQLYMVGINDATSSKNWQNGTESSKLKKMTNYLSWVMSAVYEDVNLSDTEDQIETDTLKVFFSDGIPLEETNVEEEEIDFEKYQSLKETIINKLNEPQKEIKQTKPIKRSVTQIKQQGIEDDEIIDIIPLNPEEREKMSSAEIGTAVHKLLQFIDLNEFANSDNKEAFIQKQKDHLVEKGFISSEIKDRINSDIVLSFFESPLGKRLLKTAVEDSNNVLKEMPFTFDINPNEIYSDDTLNRPIQISGIIDNCFIENNEWILIDYKTDYLRDEETKKKRIEEYKIQLKLYKKALEQLTGLKVNESHIYFLTMRDDICVNAS